MYEEMIWNFLYSKLKNAYGISALMGNLYAESSLKPISGTTQKVGLTPEEYTLITDSGRNDNFVTDNVAYGLAQWRYHTRKKGLLDLARSRGKSIGDIEIQLDYLWDEIQKYSTVLKALLNAKDIRSASDVVLLKYEKPNNKSEAVKMKRASYGQKYFDKYAGIKISIPKNNAKEIEKELENVFK